MKRTLTFGALCVAGSFAVATSALAQSSTSQSTTTTQSTSVQSSRPIQGRVVRYEAGKSIVVVGSDGREQTFPLTASVSAPADVAVGRTVSIVTEPSSSGAATVTRITTTSMGSDGSMRTDTETHTTNPDQSKSSSYSSTTAPAPASSIDSSALSGQSPDAMSAGQSTSQSTTKSTTTQSTTSDGTITGTVTAYEPGKSVTFVLPDQKTVVYTIDTTSVVPSDIAVGKTYSVQTIKSTSGNGMTVKKITTTTTKTTTNP